ncbi:MAG: hypothetical protein JST67_10940 [Bacteroidetes bacterium]|nr:hypothetical protein [Bacteroidota bacterium]
MEYISLTKNTTYPQYRKYKNGLSCFKILSPTQAQEVKAVGSKRLSFFIEATQYPERVFIHDLVFAYHHFAEEISEADFLIFSHANTR